MYIISEKGMRIFWGPGAVSLVVEIAVKDFATDNILYVTVENNEFDSYTVTKKSIYDILIGEKEEVIDDADCIELYDKYSDAKNSKFASLFKIAERMTKELSKEIEII